MPGEALSFDQFLQYIFSGITSGSIYALTALGFTLIYNATDIINFAQGELVMLGGMTAISPARCGAAAVAGLRGRRRDRGRWSASSSSSWPSGRCCRKGVLAQIIATVGASLALRTAAMLIWGRDARPLPPFSGDTPIRVARGDHPARRPCGWWA